MRGRTENELTDLMPQHVLAKLVELSRCRPRARGTIPDLHRDDFEREEAPSTVPIPDRDRISWLAKIFVAGFIATGAVLMVGMLVLG